MACHDFIHRALAHRAGDHPGMAETAAARAAAHDLDRHAVVHGIDIGNDETGGGWRQLGDDALDHRQGRFVDLASRGARMCHPGGRCAW